MKEWSLEKEQYYLGKIKDIFIGYASDPSIREGAASGGIVSALLIYLLNNNVTDGALVSRTVIKEGIFGKFARKTKFCGKEMRVCDFIIEKRGYIGVKCKK